MNKKRSYKAKKATLQRKKQRKEKQARQYLAYVPIK